MGEWFRGLWQNLFRHGGGQAGVPGVAAPGALANPAGPGANGQEASNGQELPPFDWHRVPSTGDSQDSSHSQHSSDETLGCSTVASIELEGREPSIAEGPRPQIDRQTSPSLASSANQYADPGETLIFFDWDDTLCPTTELSEYAKDAQERGIDVWDTSKELEQQLEERLAPWREALHEYLKVASSLSDHCTIITSARRPWVQKCVERFAPNLQGLIQFDPAVRSHHSERGVKVVYANSKEASSSSSPRSEGRRLEGKKDAKLQAMKQEARAFYSKKPQQTWKNILSLGDMLHEHNAVQELASTRGSSPREHLRIKAILLPQAPTITELTLRLKFSKEMLPMYVRHNTDITLNLQAAEDPLQAIARALRVPELGSIPFSRHAWGREDAPEEEQEEKALDELAVAVHELLSQERSAASDTLLEDAEAGVPTQEESNDMDAEDPVEIEEQEGMELQEQQPKLMTVLGFGLLELIVSNFSWTVNHAMFLAYQLGLSSNLPQEAGPPETLDEIVQAIKSTGVAAAALLSRPASGTLETRWVMHVISELLSIVLMGMASGQAPLTSKTRRQIIQIIMRLLQTVAGVVAMRTAWPFHQGRPKYLLVTFMADMAVLPIALLSRRGAPVPYFDISMMAVNTAVRVTTQHLSQRFAVQASPALRLEMGCVVVENVAREGAARLGPEIAAA